VAGGWGVLTADACVHQGLELVAVPEDLKTRIDELVPSRWSRSNPIDLAGGETRDTVPELLEALCAQPEVDAVIHLGIGIQSAQAAAMRGGAFFPEHGLLRIVGYHEKQDRRYAEAGRDASQRHGVPVLVATELAVTDRGNAGPEGLRAVGRFCHPSAQRAVATLSALVRWSEFAARD
jgi:acetyltransferase